MGVVARFWRRGLGSPLAVLVATWASCAAYASAAGCGNSGVSLPSEAPTCPSSTTCVADPVPHCVVEAGSDCVDSTQCPAGLSCQSPVDGADAACSDASGCFVRRCGIAGPPADPNLLGEGFSTTDMFTITPMQDASTGYSGMLPAETTSVSCALFVCAPQFGSAGGGVTIINFDECAVVAAVDPASNFSFDVGSDAYDGGATPACSANAQNTTTRRVVSMLSVGCWAYGTVGITGASPLTPILSSKATTKLVAARCSSGDDGDNCLLGPENAFGTCRKSQCRQRCLSAADCTSLESTGAAGDADGGDASSAAGLDASGGGVDCDFGGLPFSFGVCIPPAVDP